MSHKKSVTSFMLWENVYGQVVFTRFLGDFDNSKKVLCAKNNEIVVLWALVTCVYI